jgi:aldehyde dehydrogenase (NAD+)
MSRTMHFPFHQKDLFIDGRWNPAFSGRISTVFSANSEKVIGSAPDSDAADTDAAVGAARAAFDAPGGWAHWPAHERAVTLRRFANAVDSRSHEVAILVSDQIGMPINLAETGDSRRPGHLLRYYADLIDNTQGVRRTNGAGPDLRRLPQGVVAAITSWNFPNTMAALKYAPALAAGCTVVLKPSPATVLDAYHLAEAAHEAGLPPGALNIVTGGQRTGAQLVMHRDVDRVAFNGSTEVGRWIGETCGRLLRPVTLELDGKSTALILDDADLDIRNMGACLMSAVFGNNGRTRFLSSRVLAPRSRYEDVVTTVTRLARLLRVGSSLSRSTQLGPMASERHRQKVEEHIERGIDSSSRLTAGGARPPQMSTGWFVEPTVFADVDASDPLVHAEIFGPVVAVTPYEDESEAIRIAGDPEYALSGTVWTSNHERGVELARHLASRSIGINHYDVTSPMTMLSAGSVGLEFGPEAVASYERDQTIYP